MKPHEVFEVRTESTTQFKVSLKKNPSQGKFRSKMVSPPPAKGVSVFVFRVLLSGFMCFSLEWQLSSETLLEEKGCFA